MTNAGTPGFHSWRDVCLSAGAEVALALEPANGALRVRGIAFAGERSRALATTLARRGQGFELHRATLALPDLGALNEAIAMGRSGSLDLAPEIASAAPSELARLAASLGLRHAALAQAMDSRWRRRIGLFLFERPTDELEIVRIERIIRTTPWPEGDDDPFFAPASAGGLDLAEVGAALTAAAVGADIERAYRALRVAVGADRIVVLRPDVAGGEVEVVAQWPLRSVRSAPLVPGTRVAVRREPLAALAAGDVLPFGRIPTGRTIEAGEAALLGAAFRSALYFAAPAAGGDPLIVQVASHDAGQYGDDAIAQLSMAMRWAAAPVDAPRPAAGAPGDIGEELADATDRASAINRALAILVERLPFDAVALRLCFGADEEVRILATRPLDAVAARQLIDATARVTLAQDAGHARCELRHVTTRTPDDGNGGPQPLVREFADIIAGPVAEAGFEGAIAAAGERRLPGETRHVVEQWSREFAPALRRVMLAELAIDGRMRSFARALPDGLAVIDGELRAEPLNVAGRELLASVEHDPARPGHLAPGSWLAHAVLDTLATGAHHAADMPPPAGGGGVAIGAKVGRLDAARTLVVLRDLAEERAGRLRAIRLAERAAARDVLSGVAHEINNPLTSILGFAQLLEASAGDEGSRQGLRTIIEEARRAERVVRSLIAYGRPQMAERQRVDVNGCVLRVLGLRDYDRWLAGTAVQLALASPAPRVHADEDALQRALLDLVVNAEEAIARGATPGVISVSTGAADGRVRIAVADTGPGIAPEHVSRVFEPFFTTKSGGEATGLGLATAYSIVAEHGGDITVKSTPGAGATFTIDLPEA